MSAAKLVDWDLLMRFGLGVLGFAPRDFWRMTPREFDAAMKGRLGLWHDNGPMSRDEFGALAARFPDALVPDEGRKT